MRIVADLHIHSKYSRATSGRMDVAGISEWAGLKGIGIVGTGDFTHPAWLAELRRKLKPLGNGLFSCGRSDVLFMLSAEVSNIFEHKGQTKKIHTVLLAPSFEIAEQLNDALAKFGDLSSDGRPILSNSASETVEIATGFSREVMVIPAHIWTPWFSMFGSKSGFDSVGECYGEMAGRITALETGLSSDPAMNWRVSALDKYALVSNSDAHSPEKLGREANVFDFEEEGGLSYSSINKAIKTKDSAHFKFTYEFYPEEGKYHWDGHRSCGVSLSPREALACKNVCPVCKRALTLGVLHRVEELADRPDGFVPEGAIPFKKIVPLQEIIATSLGKSAVSQAVSETYNLLVRAFGSEFAVLDAEPAAAESSARERTAEAVEKIAGARIADAIRRVHDGKVCVTPGYDGVFGTVGIFGEKKPKTRGAQSTLSSFG